MCDFLEAEVDFPQIVRVIEAALLASPQPLTLLQLRELFSETHTLPPGSIESALEQLHQDFSTRGVHLIEVASGYRFQIATDIFPWVQNIWTERKTKYSRATLETLALIAYRQPITRGDIEKIRGVAVSSSIIQSLEEREWIRVVGYRDMPGRPALLGTTQAFLDYFGLKCLSELPLLAQLKVSTPLDPPAPVLAAANTTVAEDSLPLVPEPEPTAC